MDRSQIDSTVTRLVAEIFEQEVENIREDMSLLDELDAESLDFIDLTYRLEEVFDIEVPQDEVYRGSLDLEGKGFVVDGQVNAEGMSLIRDQMPGFDLSRFPGEVIRASDLPRLVTVRTVCGYITQRLSAPDAG